MTDIISLQLRALLLFSAKTPLKRGVFRAGFHVNQYTPPTIRRTTIKTTIKAYPYALLAPYGQPPNGYVYKTRCTCEARLLKNVSITAYVGEIKRLRPLSRSALQDLPILYPFINNPCPFWCHMIA